MPHPCARYRPRLCPRGHPSDDAWAKSRKHRARTATTRRATPARRRGQVLPTLQAALCASVLLANSALAQDPVADFYRGRQVNLIVGYGPGGGYDIVARLLARHLARQLPGNPSIVVQNMPGAGTCARSTTSIRSRRGTAPASASSAATWR